jgi:ATP-dependent Clp protease adaptor protein ClpS
MIDSRVGAQAMVAGLDCETVVTTKPRERSRTKTRRIPPYNVILENDDYHSMDFVVDVLLKVLGCTMRRALLLMLQAHTAGRAVIWTGSKEGAELKVEQVRTYHETRAVDGIKLGPLDCNIEPCPGT